MALHFTPSSQSDSENRPLIEGPCTIVRPLIVGVEVDEEVGPMFRIVQADGQEVDAYADEITGWAEREDPYDDCDCPDHEHRRWQCPALRSATVG